MRDSKQEIQDEIQEATDKRQEIQAKIQERFLPKPKDTLEGQVANWIHQQIYPAGKRLGEWAFDRLSHEKRNRAIQSQREPYSDTIANAFVTYLFLWSVPFVWEVYTTLGAMTAPTNAPPPYLWTLLASDSTFNFEIYGVVIVLYGSSRLSTRLFDNFLVGSMEKGKSLAMAHAAIVFIVTGYVFQLAAQYGNGSISEQTAGREPGVDLAVDFLLFVFTNLDQVIPFFVAVAVSQVAFAVVISGIRIRATPDDPQTTITSDRWERADAAHSSVENESE